MEGNKEFLGTEPVGKLLFRLSIPTVVAQLVNMLYNIVDRIYIGHMPGDGSLALTGVGVCMPLIMLVSAFAALVSSGGAPWASIFMGKNEYHSAEKTLGNCFSLQVIISLILTAVLLLWSKELLLAFGASENTIGYATDYMGIYAIGTLFVQLTLGMNFFITAQGFTRISMVSVLIGAVANIALDPVFIFGFHMGVRGAALATIISQALSCTWVVGFLCSKKTRLRLKKENLGLQAGIILPCIALGTAAFIMQASESIISVCFNSSLLQYGGDIAVGVCRGVEAGVLDVPFAPCRANAGLMLPCRDNNGAVRILNPGNLPFSQELKDFHAAKIDERAKAENRKASFQMVIDDVYAIGKGRLVGRPRY